MDNLAQALDDFIGEEYATQNMQSFVIDTPDKAEWALSKIAKYQTSINDARNLATKRIEQIDAWMTKVWEENQKQIDFFTALLEPYAKQQITGKKKSIKLPTGTFGFREQKDKTIKDDMVLLEWVKQSAPEYIEPVPTLNWQRLKDNLRFIPNSGVAVDPFGEVVEGVKREKQPDKFYVKVE